MITVLIFLIIISALIISLKWKKLQRFFVLHQRAQLLLKDMPGPPTIPIFGSAHLFKWDNEDFTYQLEDWARKYIALAQPFSGMMKVWIGPIPLVILASCESVKPILESNTLIVKPSQYDFLTTWIGQGLLTSTNKKWYSRRKMLTPTFHFNVLHGYYEIFGKQADILADCIEKYAETNEEFDMFPYIKRCALDIICETAMGTEMMCQKGGNIEYVEAVMKLSLMIWDHERFPWLWLKPVWYLSGLGREFDRLVKLTNDFTRKVISERRETLENSGVLSEMDALSEEQLRKHKFSFLDLLIGMQRTEKLTDEDIREEVDTFMFEGHDTTSSGMGFTLWWLGQEPEYQKMVHKELDEVFGSSTRFPTSEDLKQLHFLEKCIKESHRLTPPVPLIARQLVHDVTIAGYTIPKDCTVVVTPVSCQRDPRHFRYAESFYPDHFSPEMSASRDPYAFIPFSAGPRNCIGQKFALFEEKAVVSTVLRRYRIQTVQPWPMNRPLPELILKPAHGFRFKLFKR